MIRFIPKRESVSASIKEEQTFCSLEEMKNSLFSQLDKISKYIDVDSHFSINEIIVSEIIENNIYPGMKNMRKVSIKSLTTFDYPVPETIGYCGD